VIRLTEVHKSDINTVDWSAQDENYVATGSNDTLVKLIDTRRLSSQFDAAASQANKSGSGQSPIVGTLHKHKSKVQTVKFCNSSSQYLASSGDSLIFWDIKDM
jgi:WD40 repeat protein